MEVLAPVDIERTAQRANVAAFIQNNLQPVAHIINEPDDEQQEFEVRDYQLDALDALWEAREQGETSGMVILATGLGKTSVGVADVVKFREEHRAKWGTDPYILFTSNKDSLGEQAAKRFAAFMPDASQGFYNGKQKVRDAELTFATLQSLYRNLDSFEPDEYDYIIYDEAHHDKAETFEAVVNHFTPEFQLALTATPYRLDGKEIGELFGPAKYTKGLGEALAEGLLSDIDYHIVFDEAVKSALEGGFLPETLRELRELLEVPQRNDSIADNIRQKMEEIGQESAKTIVFCNDTAHADIMAELLGGKAYHSGRDDRKEVLDEFRNGDLQIICVRDMFNEGLDIPDANLLVFLRSTESRTIFEQQLGRGLRKHPGKERVSVLDFVGNIKRLEDIVDLSNTISDLSSQYGVDDLLDAGDKQRETGSFKVSTNHTNFDFEKMVVDVLSTYQTLIFEKAPEGYKSLNAFAQEIGADAKRLKKLVAHHQIETDRHWFGNSVGTSLSPEVQEQIMAVVELIPEAPEGYVKLTELAEEFNLSSQQLRRTFLEHNIPLGQYNFDGNTAIGFSPETQQVIRELGITPLEQIPEGYASVKAFARELGVSENKLTRNIGQYDIPTERFKVRTAPGACLSPEAQEQIRVLDLSGWPLPEGYVSVSDYAKELQTGHSHLMKQLRELDLEPDKYNVDGVLRFCLSPAEQQQIEQAYYAADAQRAPEDYVSVTEMARRADVGRKTLVTLIAKNDIEVERVYFRGSGNRGNQLSEALSPESQMAVAGLIQAAKAEPAPEGYISVNRFVRQSRIALPTIQKIMEEHGIEADRHRFRTHTVASLSPEAQEQILTIHAQLLPPAPEGYVSVLKFAESLGTDNQTLYKFIAKHDIEIEQHVFGRMKRGGSLSPAAQRQIRELRNSK
jgi:superfamily II DNA or RNA helicase